MIKKYVTKKQRVAQWKNKIRKILFSISAVLLVAIVVTAGKRIFVQNSMDKLLSATDIPKYNGQTYCVINDNHPFFTPKDMISETFEMYSDLDYLGRCGTAFANISQELMPTEAREELGSIKPSGWMQEKYEGIIDSSPPYLYNRCHLIEHCLTAENANYKNLITGTRYMNIEGMLPFEEQVRQYLKSSNNHVLYRVTPIFEGDNLLANGVLMEAYSIEDDGEGISFCVYCYNVQPGIIINYSNGASTVQ